MRKWNSMCSFNIMYSLATLSSCYEIKFFLWSDTFLFLEEEYWKSSPNLICFSSLKSLFSIEGLFLKFSHTKPLQTTSWCFVMTDITIILFLVEMVFHKSYHLTLLSLSLLYLPIAYLLLNSIGLECILPCGWFKSYLTP